MREAHLVADDGGDEATEEHRREVQLPLVREEPGGEEQRVAGKEEADEERRLGEDDQDQADFPIRAEGVEDLLRVEADGQHGEHGGAG